MDLRDSSLEGITSKVGQYLQGISSYLSKYREREELTQNGMAGKLGLSLNRYREYEQNTTDNSKGISLDLLLRICALEGIPLEDFLAKVSGVSRSGNSEVDTLEAALLAEWRNVPLDDRQAFIRNVLPAEQKLEFSLETKSGPDGEPLIPQKMRWTVRVSNLLAQLPYEARMKFEREIIEEYMAIKRPAPDSPEHTLLLDRLRELIRQYYTNFEGGRK
jgi:transcriptional regulator with XRE-family HTH domain